jgi:hypothetical protein
MKTNMSRITTHIPNDLASWVWDTYKKLGGKGAKPCSCPSSAKLWKQSVERINSFLKSYDN